MSDKFCLNVTRFGITPLAMLDKLQHQQTLTILDVCLHPYLYRSFIPAAHKSN